MPRYTVYTCAKNITNPETDDIDIEDYDMPNLGALKRAMIDICNIGYKKLLKVDGVSPQQWARCDAILPPPEQPEPVAEPVELVPPAPVVQTIQTVQAPTTSSQWHEFSTDGIPHRIDLSTKLVQKKGWVKVDNSDYKIMLLDNGVEIEVDSDLLYVIYKKDWVKV